MDDVDKQTVWLNDPSFTTGHTTACDWRSEHAYHYAHSTEVEMNCVNVFIIIIGFERVNLFDKDGTLLCGLILPTPCIVYRGNMSSRLYSNSEANASKLQENIEDVFLHYLHSRKSNEFWSWHLIPRKSWRNHSKWLIVNCGTWTKERMVYVHH